MRDIFNKNLIDTISKYVYFSEDEWEIIISSFSLKKLKKGDYFIQQGAVCKYVAFVANGFLRSYFSTESKEITTDFIFKNTFTSAYKSFLTQEPSEENIQALIDTNLLVMSYEQKNSLFKIIPNWEKLARYLTEEHFIRKDNKVKLLNNSSAIERYQQLLSKDREQIISKIPLHYIASYLGIAPETLSRIRKKIATS